MKYSKVKEMLRVFEAVQRVIDGARVTTAADDVMDVIAERKSHRTLVEGYKSASRKASYTNRSKAWQAVGNYKDVIATGSTRGKCAAALRKKLPKDSPGDPLASTKWGSVKIVAPGETVKGKLTGLTWRGKRTGGDIFAKYDKKVSEGKKRSVTHGMANAMGKNATRTCDDCGMSIPRYKGRYPQACPDCGGRLSLQVDASGG